MPDFSSSVATSRYFPALTGVRAVAALLVFFYHVVQNTDTESLGFTTKWLLRWLQQGRAGVTVFFVLSGFLITVRYSHGIRLSRPWFRRYLQNRFARIYPIYFLLTAFSFAAMLVAGTHHWYEWPESFGRADMLAAVLLNLTLTRAYFEDMLVLGVPTAWTLTVEETFYLCAPLLIVGLQRHRKLLVVYPVVLLAIGAGLVAASNSLGLPWGFMRSNGFMLGRTFFGNCVPFIVGMQLARMLLRAGPAANGSGLATLVGGVGTVLWLGLMAVLDQCAPVAFVLAKNALALPVALWLWGLIKERTALQRLLASRLFEVLGKSSYVFYLVHLGAIDTYFGQYVADSWPVRLLAYWLLSVLLYRFVELPLHRLLRAKPAYGHAVPAPVPGKLIDA